jgi:TRAP-type C4-dicarboxylate transport system permease large subunit
MLPYLAVIVTGLLLVAFVPWFSLVLPKTLGFL